MIGGSRPYAPLPMVVLAGGVGSRLGDDAAGVPKPIVDVGGEPFLRRVLRLVARAGIERVQISVGYGGDQVESAIGPGHDLGLDIGYVADGPMPLGTGGALRRAMAGFDGPCFVMNGDSYLPCDYRSVQASFEQAGLPALMVVHHNADRWDRSNVIVEEGLVAAYDKWAPRPGMEFIDYGLGVLTQEAVAEVPAEGPSDLGRLFQSLAARRRLAAVEAPERFYEIGSPSGLAEFREVVARGIVG